MQKFKSILDNIIGRCPSCYYNLLHIFCDMACNPRQDQFTWPLETINITRPTNDQSTELDLLIREEWAEQDYVNPEEEEEDEMYSTVETVTVVKKLRYFITEKLANDFINSCWYLCLFFFFF